MLELLDVAAFVVVLWSKGGGGGVGADVVVVDGVFWVSSACC